MSDTRLVWFAPGALPLIAPRGAGRLVYHGMGGVSWYRTRCGKPTGTGNGYVPVRRDTADLIADPCRICWHEHP